MSEPDITKLWTRSFMKQNNYFVYGIENYHLINPLEILNWYRNLYYQEEFPSERRIMAEAINDLSAKYKDAFRYKSEVG